MTGAADRSLARLYRRGRVAMALSAAALAALLVLVIADVEGPAMGAAASLAIFFGGVSWWSKGRYLITTGAVRPDPSTPPGASGVRAIGVILMCLGGLAILLGAVLFAAGVAS